MKKVIALALAMVMILGLSTVALADTASDNATADKVYPSGIVFYEDNEGNMVEYSDSGNARSTGDYIGNMRLNPGKTVYIPLAVPIPSHPNTIAVLVEGSEDVVKKLHVYTDWTVGKTETPTIVLKKLNTATGGFQNLGYVYCLAIELPEVNGAGTYDLAGRIGVGRTKEKALDPAKAREIGAEIRYGIDESYSYQVTEQAPILKFDSTGVEEITWGDDVASFEVDVQNQSKLNLDWNTKFDADVTAMYDYANLDFLTFPQKPSFNKTGTLRIPAEPDTFLYEKTDDGVKAVKDAKYDESYGAWTLTTRTLGSYILADRELTTVTSSSSAASTPEEAPTTGTTQKPNPATGR